MRVVVVGAGVVGLSCAVLLAEAGHEVEVRSDRQPQDTTSAVAAALWYPYRAQPMRLVTAWGARTYEVLAGLAGAEPSAGVRMRAGTELLREPARLPPWADTVPDVERLVDVPAGYAGGWTFTAPVVDMGTYLPGLLSRLEAARGRLVQVRLDALPADADLVVNASGLGARELVGDESVRPVRGQVLHVEPCGVDRWWLDGAGLTYVVPRERVVVVGGSDEDGSADLDVDPAQAEQILMRAVAMVPRLGGARVLAHHVGLRPARPSVRLERDDRLGGPPVVHCYGHGGAGLTLSWGCAEEVVARVQNSRSDGSSSPRSAS